MDNELLNQDELDMLMNVGKDAKLATNLDKKSWDGRIAINGLNKVNPGIRQFIEKDIGDSLSAYARRALITQLKKDGFII